MRVELPASRWVRLDWAGHLPSLEDPDRFNPLLLDFLTGVSSAGVRPAG